MEATAVKARLEDAHPEYLALRGHYEFMRQAYEGGWEYIRDNIFRHGPRETHADYIHRLERAVYPNYCRPVIRTYRNHVFRFGDRIGRNIGDDVYRRWAREDVDRRGSDANHFWSCVATLELLYGWAGVLVDMPKPTESVRSAADQQSTDQMPYFILVSPLQIVDWGMDEFGALEWIRIEESQHGASDPFASRVDRKRYRLWTRSEWMLLDGDGAVIEGGEHSLGVVPFVPIRFEESVRHELAGVSFMSDFARINRMIANSVSLRDGFLAKNMLQILTMQVNFMAEAGNDTDLSQSLQDGSMLEYAPDTKAPSFIAPDVAGVEWALAHAEELRWELFRIATQKDIRSQGTMQGQSGLSKMLDFEEQNAALALFADGLERAETQATKLWFAWRGVPWDDAWRIDYPDNFQIRSLEADLALALQVREAYGDASPSFVSRYMRQLGGRLVDDLGERERRVFAEELDANLTGASSRETGPETDENETPDATSDTTADATGAKPSDEESDAPSDMTGAEAEKGARV